MASKKLAAKALVNITHDGKTFKIDEIMKLNASDAKKLSELGYVEILETESNGGENGAGEGNNKGTNEKNKGGE